MYSPCDSTKNVKHIWWWNSTNLWKPANDKNILATGISFTQQIKHSTRARYQTMLGQYVNMMKKKMLFTYTTKSLYITYAGHMIYLFVRLKSIL